MRYLITFWTGETQTVDATGVRSAFESVYGPDSDGAWVSEESGTGYGYVLNRHGDDCAVIRRADALPVWNFHVDFAYTVANTIEREIWDNFDLTVYPVEARRSIGKNMTGPIDARTVVKRIRPARQINGVLPIVWDTTTRTPVTFDLFVARFGMAYVKYVSRPMS